MRIYALLSSAIPPLSRPSPLVLSHLQVQTDAFVLLVDADFVPSGKPGAMHEGFYSDPLLRDIHANWKGSGAREVAILPAFGRLRRNLHDEPRDSPCFKDNDECWLYQKVDVPYTKEKLIELVDAGEMESFYREQVRDAGGWDVRMR